MRNFVRISWSNAYLECNLCDPERANLGEKTSQNFIIPMGKICIIEAGALFWVGRSMPFHGAANPGVLRGLHSSSRGREGRGAVDGQVHFLLDVLGLRAETHRVKDCTFPASTLMMFPVDFEEASEAKKYAASAMSSGSTDRFRSDRWRYISSRPALSVP